MRYYSRNRAYDAFELHGGWIFVFGSQDFEHVYCEGDAIDMIVALSGDTVDTDQAKKILARIETDGINVIYKSDIEEEMKNDPRK